MDSPTSRTVVMTTSRMPAMPSWGGKYLALAVLFVMNTLNYVDRYAFFAVNTHIQEELHIDDYWFGWLGSAFMIVYTAIAPFTGWLGDRYNRKLLIFGGVGLWSLATVGAALSGDFYHMFFWRALLGIGEASYGVIAPALLADLFPMSERGRAMGVYYLALPVGTALGFFMGGTIGDAFGWRAVFWVVGLPGLLAAAAALVISDPGRGASDLAGAKVKTARPGLSDYLELFKTKTFVFNTLGMAAVTFATGAYAAWGSAFYQRIHGLTAAEAGQRIGFVLVGAGLIGILLGMFVPDLIYKVTRRAYLLLAAIAVLCSVPLGLVGILERHTNTSVGYLFCASVCLSMVLGPCNTVTANVVPASRRAAAYACFIFFIHLLGDISSPILLGWISDLFGKPIVMASSIGRFFASIGATPVDTKLGPTNLTVAMLAVGPILLLGFLFFVVGSIFLPADQEKVRGAGGVSGEDLAQFHH
jgi:MFS transporter, Spinster family, sphingosine-1-phosphate transporter